MKKSQSWMWMLCLAASLSFTSSVNAEIDEKLFLEPHLSTLAGKVAFNGGEVLSQDKKHSYDHAISLNIGVNLPSTTHLISEADCKAIGLGAHMKKLSDSLKDNGVAIITAPASYGVVFTTGIRSNEEIAKEIESTLAKLTSLDAASIVSTLGTLQDVSRATFVERNGKLTLVTSEKDLTLGETVWRKTAAGVEKQIYHSEEEYLVSIAQAGLKCEEIKRPCFFGQVKWKQYNQSCKEASAALGSAYQEHNPFTIYYVRKA